MMKKKFYKIFSLVLLFAIFSSCKKESKNLFNMFDDLKVDYRNAIAADDVYVEFKLTKVASGANMGKVIITETGSTTPIYTKIVPYVQRYIFESGVVILKATNPQTVTYKITVLDDLGNDITSQVTITYPTGNLKALNPVLVNDSEVINFAEGSTVYLDYTIKSENTDINSVKLESFAKGLATQTDTIIASLTDNDNRRNYRGATRIALTRDGLTRYRVYALNKADDYMGDGYKHVNTNVNVGYELSANKFIYAPDTTSAGAKPNHFTSACFYSISLKKAFTYEEAKAHSADIDFGIYLTASGIPSAPFRLNLYSITTPPAILTGIYDFSTWTKRATKFGPSTTDVAQPNNLPSISSSVVFGNMFSGASIKDIITGGRYAAALTRTSLTAIASGSIIFFRNEEGKYGAIFINGFAKDYQKRYFTNIDVKVEK